MNNPKPLPFGPLHYVHTWSEEELCEISMSGLDHLAEWPTSTPALRSSLEEQHEWLEELMESATTYLPHQGFDAWGWTVRNDLLADNRQEHMRVAAWSDDNAPPMLLFVQPPYSLRDDEWTELHNLPYARQDDESLLFSPGEKLYSFIIDTCKRSNANFFVLTSYDKFMFGALDKARLGSYKTAPMAGEQALAWLALWIHGACHLFKSIPRAHSELFLCQAKLSQVLHRQREERDQLQYEHNRELGVAVVDSVARGHARTTEALRLHHQHSAETAWLAAKIRALSGHEEQPQSSSSTLLAPTANSSVAASALANLDGRTPLRDAADQNLTLPGWPATSMTDSFEALSGVQGDVHSAVAPSAAAASPLYLPQPEPSLTNTYPSGGAAVEEFDMSWLLQRPSETPDPLLQLLLLAPTPADEPAYAASALGTPSFRPSSISFNTADWDTLTQCGTDFDAPTPAYSTHAHEDSTEQMSSSNVRQLELLLTPRPAYAHLAQLEQWRDMAPAEAPMHMRSPAPMTAQSPAALHPFAD